MPSANKKEPFEHFLKFLEKHRDNEEIFEQTNRAFSKPADSKSGGRKPAAAGMDNSKSHSAQAPTTAKADDKSEKPECKTCGKKHRGKCRKEGESTTRRWKHNCLFCDGKKHRMVDCTKFKGYTSPQRAEALSGKSLASTPSPNAKPSIKNAKCATATATTQCCAGRRPAPTLRQPTLPSPTASCLC